MKRSSNKFLHRVRIHGGEFDASARAMHREGMTSSFQAAAEKLSIATNERKQMSTKTTFKRVALVTVAALGFGVLATVPSQATVSANSLTLASATSSQQTGETSTASAGLATLTFLNTNVGDTVSVTAYLMSAPAGNTVSPVLQVSDTVSAAASLTALSTPLATGYENTSQVVYVSGTAATAAVSAKFKVYMNSASKAGTYVIKLVPNVVAGGGVIDTTGVTLTITVTTNPALDTVAASATSIINTGETNTAATDATVTGTKKVVASNATATIKVSLKNAAAVAITSESYTATISGSGQLGSGPQTTTNAHNISAVGRAITVKAGDVVRVFSDGTSGVGTITINSSLGVILATEKVTFFGTATSIVSTLVSNVLAGGGPNVGAIDVAVTDAAGTVVSNAAALLYVTSDALTKVSNSYDNTSCTFVSATQNYSCDLTGGVAGTANITVGTLSSATDTTAGAINGNKVAVRVGSTTAASIVWTLDKASYAPGDKATLTATLLDSTGLLVAAGDYVSIMKTGGFAPSRELGVSSDTLTATGILGVEDGVRKYTIYMPLTEGTLTLTGKTAGTAVTGTAPSAGSGLLVANQAVAVVLTASVVSSSGSAATDAANEATDAANAATDAANAAAEAADAATAAAQDAADAVAALSTEVAGLIAALKAQITSLTNLVIKIQKKIKA